MEEKSLRKSAFLAFFLALLALVTLVSSTYAWFSFRAFTNATPMSGAISNGDGDLLISNSPNGPFDMSCELLLEDPDAELLPLTTADLENFYAVSAQNAAGIASAYRTADDRAANNTLNGTVYLKADGNGFDVYLWLPSLDCGTDDQALAAMRLGLRIHTSAGVKTHIFRLDELGSTARVEEHRTIPQADCVVEEINADGEPSYVADVAKNLSVCAARGEADNVVAGDTALCSLSAGETATVHFWLYLEGCDDHCINCVQGSDIALQLGFAGVQNEQ